MAQGCSNGLIGNDVAQQFDGLDNAICLITSNKKDPETNYNACTTDWNTNNIHYLKFNTQGNSCNYVCNPHIAVDNNKYINGNLNQYYGNTYVLWTEVEANGNGYLNDNNWKIQFATVNVDGNYSNGTDIASKITDVVGSSNTIQVEPGEITVGTDGTIFISWLEYSTTNYYNWFSQNNQRPTNCFIHIKYSGDGGATFQDYSSPYRSNYDLNIYHPGIWYNTSILDGAWCTDFGKYGGLANYRLYVPDKTKMKRRVP